jgi:hypothetical protein
MLLMTANSAGFGGFDLHIALHLALRHACSKHGRFALRMQRATRIIPHCRMRLPFLCAMVSGPSLTTATDRAVERATENAGALYRSLADMQVHLYEW